MREHCRDYLIARMGMANLPVRPRMSTREAANELFASEAADFARATDTESLPRCFATDWAAVSTSPCRRCKVQVRCLTRQTFTLGPASAPRHADRAVMQQLYAIIQDGRDSPVPRRQRKGERRVAEPWGPPTFAKRWLAERERNPLFAQIGAGTILERTYKGQHIVVRVGSGFYEFNGEHFPTLYAVTKAATGTHTYASRERQQRRTHAWSAKRFFFDAIHRAASMGL